MAHIITTEGAGKKKTKRSKQTHKPLQAVKVPRFPPRQRRDSKSADASLLAPFKWLLQAIRPPNQNTKKINGGGGVHGEKLGDVL